MEKNLHCVYSAYSLCIRNEFSVNITVNLLCEVLREHFPFDVNKGKMFTKNFTARILLTLLCFYHTCICMHVESYWESWVLKDYPDDWCALLKEVPASRIGSKEGANYICIGR